MDQRVIRVVLAKTTMDAHDRGVRYLATKLREAGMEVIFMNFFEPAEILDAATQEDADVIGISSSVEGHLPSGEGSDLASEAKQQRGRVGSIRRGHPRPRHRHDEGNGRQKRIWAGVLS